MVSRPTILRLSTLLQPISTKSLIIAPIFQSGGQNSVSVMDFDQSLIAFDIGGNGSGTHMSLEPEDGIADIVEMWNLDFVKKNHIFQFG